jgi:N-dimethylarginine dimethylaminohydrolase
MNKPPDSFVRAPAPQNNGSRVASRDGTAAYGGPGWSERTATLTEELGGVWSACGIDSEWNTLEAVMLHRPGDELAASRDPNAVQMLAALDVDRAQVEFDAMTAALEASGVEVHPVVPDDAPLPNQMFCADLFVMTPEGAILGRPASTVRAGEERQVARRLAALGVPIVRSVSGAGTFEGADLMWLDRRTAIIGRGLRTNDAGVRQVKGVLKDMEVEVVVVDMSPGTMHLMGVLRIADRDLAVVWHGRTPPAAVDALEKSGYEIVALPDADPFHMNRAMNFVTLGPRRILMADGYPRVKSAFESRGVECSSASVDELSKAAGGFGCLTGVLRRAPCPA